MTFGDVIIAYIGYYDHQNREDVRARTIAYVGYCSIPDKKKKKPIEKFWPLPSDEDYKEKVFYSPNERAERLKAFREKELKEKGLL